MSSPDKTTFVYNYTEKSIDGINRSIDITTDKLTKVLAFSGVLLKFAVDMPSEEQLFGFKTLVLGALMAAIGLCASGIWPREGGKSNLKAAYFSRMLREAKTATSEQFQEAAVKSWLEVIPDLEELRDYRIGFLNKAIGCLVFAGIVFGLAGFVEAIH